MGASVAAQLAGMPEPFSLERFHAEGQVLIYRGPHVFAAYDEDDLGMRNLAIVGLTNARFSCKDVARCFGLTPQYVSMLRGRAKDRGSAGLVRPRGRRRSLSDAKLARAAEWSRQGMSNVAIGKRLGVHSGTVGRRLAAMEHDLLVGAPPAPDALFVNEERVDPVAEEPSEPEGPRGRMSSDQPAPPIADLRDTEVTSRYAGAMLLHPFLTRLGADQILAALPKGAARRYDAASLVLASTFSFALGTSSLEGTKHLVGKDAGALVGAGSFPHVRTLRPGLAALAEASDPIVLQTAFAKAMLDADEHPPEIFYADDHFVTYWGNKPVAKGYNIRRHLAEPGRDDTFVTDDTWRAVCFASGEPRGLSVTLPGVLSQLQAIVGVSRVMVGFDRGASYPKVFTALAEANMEWITWRRAPLVPPTVAPRRTEVDKDGRRHTVFLADELVELHGYDATAVRQLSAYEDGKVVFQVLTSNTALDGAELVERLRGRLCIENTNKYLEDHQGIHWLATYEMDREANTARVRNPVYKAATARVREAKAALAEAQRAFGDKATHRSGDVDAHLAALSELHDALTIATDDLDEAREGLKGIPAKVPANELDPTATRAKPHLAPRALQMVCRLLAYNAELDLARHLNTYLADNDEYRAITRNLLHLGGTIAFGPRSITVTLDRPGSPRVAKAVGQLLGELAAGAPAHLAGDERPISYQMAG